MNDPRKAYAEAKKRVTETIKDIINVRAEYEAMGLTNEEILQIPKYRDLKERRHQQAEECERLKLSAKAANIAAKDLARQRREKATLDRRGNIEDPDDEWIFSQVFKLVRGFDRHIIRKTAKRLGRESFLLLISECRVDAAKADDAKVDFDTMMRNNYNKFSGEDL